MVSPAIRGHPLLDTHAVGPGREAAAGAAVARATGFWTAHQIAAQFQRAQ